MAFHRGRLLPGILLVVISSSVLTAGSLSAGSADRGAPSLAFPAITTSDVANLIRVPLIRQYTDYTCGVAALESIFAYYGQDFRGDKLAEALRTTPQNGTAYRDIIRAALSNGYNVRKYDPMTIDQLKAFINLRTPVLLLIQAWPEKPVEDWWDDWEDGHYVVAIGYDIDNVYFMDPATTGNYTYIPVHEFLARWHDVDPGGEKLINFGIVIDRKEPVYNPDQIKPLD
jgi:predicted double-glycine peptidase